MSAMLWGVRPHLFGFSIAPVVLVSLLLELGQGLETSRVRTGACVLCAVCTQAGLHLINTFCDHRSEVDRKGLAGGDTLLVENHAPPMLVLSSGAALVGGGVALGLLLGADLVAGSCLLGGVVLGVLYSFPLKHYYCGDVIVMLCFGPALAQFTASVHGMEGFATEFIPMLLPHILLVNSWLMICNARDVPHDTKVKSDTLACGMGGDEAALAYCLIVLLACLAVLQLVVFSSLWYGVVLLSAPLANSCLRGGLKSDFKNTPRNTLLLHALVTALTAVGAVLASVFRVSDLPPADSIF